jgi:iron complex outermembrane receptor protein
MRKAKKDAVAVIKVAEQKDIAYEFIHYYRREEELPISAVTSNALPASIRRHIKRAGDDTMHFLRQRLILVLLAFAGVVNAQFHLQEVQVVAQQTEIQSQAYRLVTRIDREVIAALSVSTLSDLLQTLPGLDIRARGASGAQADVSMRGGTFDQVMILLNGVCVSDAQTGHYAMNIPIPLSAIERIEVLEGAAASLAGGNAFCGAINIVTRQMTNDQSPITNDTYHVAMQMGMNRFAKAELTGGWKRNEWHILASADYAHNNGYYAPLPTDKEATALKNSDFNGANIYLNAAWRGLEMQVGAQYKDVGAGMFYGFGSQDQFDATRTAFGSARYTHSWGKWSLDALAAYRANHDRYEWHRGTVSNRHLTQNATASLHVHYASSVGKTTVGIEARNEHIHSTNFGDHNRLNFHYLAQQTFHVQHFSASLTAGGIYNTSFAHHWTVGADLGYAFDCGVSLYANANRSLRMPTFTDLYYDAGNQLGNVDLIPEKAWTASFGAAYQHVFDQAGTLAINGEFYHRWGRDIIDWIYVPTDTKRPYHAQNQQRVNTLGIECSVQYRLNKWLRNVQLSYAYTHLDINLQQTNSRYLDYLRHKIVLQIEHGIYAGLGASWTLSYRDRVGQFNHADGTVTDFRPVLLLDAKIYYDIPHWRFALSCTNMTNRHYYDYGGVLQPGAWAKISIEYHL